MTNPVKAGGDSIVAYWDFNEGYGSVANDYTNGNDGAIGSPTWKDGISGSALFFNGTHDYDYVDVPDSPTLDITDSISIEAWIFVMDRTGDHQVIVAKWYRDETPDVAYVLELQPNGRTLQMPIGGGVASGGISPASSDRLINFEEWVYVVGTYDGSAVRLYLNGEMTCTYHTSGDIPSTGSNLFIGSHDSLLDRNPFYGYIDEVRICDRALTLEEIDERYDSIIENRFTHLPSAPLDLRAKKNGDDIVLTWEAPPFIGGSAISNYCIYRGVTAPSLLVVIGNTLTYVDTDIEKEQDYLYQVSAVNGNGEGSRSEVASIIYFDPLMDGFSFDNPGWKSSCSTLSLEEVKTILLNDEFYYHLDEGPFSDLKFMLLYLKAKEMHKGGHCYGMCALAMNYYHDNLPTPGYLAPYSINYEQVAMDIEYYHSLQVINVSFYSLISSWGTEGSPINDRMQWDIIRTVIGNDEPVIIGLGSDTGRHAVIGYGIDGGGDVLIYDPTDPPTETDPLNRITVIEEGDDVSIEYRSDWGMTFDSWIALSYEQANVIEWYFDKLKDAIWILADCPVQLSVQGPDGKLVADTLSDGEAHLALILDPHDREYMVEVVGTGSGDYQITVARETVDCTTYRNVTGEIEKGERIGYIISYSDTEISLKKAQDDSGRSSKTVIFMLLIGVFLLIMFIIALLFLIILRSINRVSK